MKILASFLYWLGDFFSNKGKGSSGSFSRLDEIEKNSVGARFGASSAESRGITNLHDAIAVYRRATNPSQQDQAAFEVSTRVNSFSDWLCVVKGVDSSTPLGRQAIERLVSTAVSFDENKEAYKYTLDRDTQLGLTRKLASLAITIDEKLKVYEFAGPESSIGESIYKEIISQPRTRGEWYDMFNGADGGSPLEHFAALRVIEMTDKVEALAEFSCEGQVSDTDLESTVLAKLRSSTATFKDWQSVCGNYDGTVSALAVEKMIETASSIDELLEVEDSADEDDGTEGMFVAKAKTSLLWTEKSCRNVLESYDGDSSIFCIAVEKIMEMATTPFQCLQIYLEFKFDEDSTKVIFKRLGELATSSERAIIALVADEGSDLQEWAEQTVSLS